MDILQSGEFSDFTIINGKDKYLLHRVFLSRCGYFKILFNSTMKEVSEAIVKFDYPPLSFRLFIVYLYTNTIDIDDSNITDIIELAIYFQHSKLLETCVSKLDIIPSDYFIDIMNKYPHIVNMISVEEFRDKCIKEQEYMISNINRIADVNMITKVIDSYQNIHLFDIVTMIESLPANTKVFMWRYMENMTFHIEPTIYDKLCDNYPHVLTQPLIRKTIKSFLNYGDMGIRNFLTVDNTQPEMEVYTNNNPDVKYRLSKHKMCLSINSCMIYISMIGDNSIAIKPTKDVKIIITCSCSSKFKPLYTTVKVGVILNYRFTENIKYQIHIRSENSKLLVNPGVMISENE